MIDKPKDIFCPRWRSMLQALLLPHRLSRIDRSASPKAPTVGKSTARALRSFACMDAGKGHERGAVSFQETVFNECRTMCTMQSCTSVCGKTASMASGKPVRPSTQAIRTSLRPRFLSSVNTDNQNLAPRQLLLRRLKRLLLVLY